MMYTTIVPQANTPYIPTVYRYVDTAALTGGEELQLYKTVCIRALPKGSAACGTHSTVHLYINIRTIFSFSFFFFIE